MNTIWLVFYAFHGIYGHGATSSPVGGGPALTITQMPSIAVCEAVGTATAGMLAGMPSIGRDSPPRQAVYRCVVAPR